MKTNASIVALAAVGLAAVAVSQDASDWAMPAITPAEQQIAPAFDPSVVSEERWVESMTPGPEHKMLDQLVGEWDVEQRLWMPGAPEPMVSPMTAITEWALGGKHIKETLTGQFMGEPYEGFGVTSYDKYNNRYNFFWADSWSTSSYYSTGFATADGGAIEAYGTMDEPMMEMRGKTVKYVLRAVSPDAHTFEIHDLHIGGDNTKVMELVYTRKK